MLVLDRVVFVSRDHVAVSVRNKPSLVNLLRLQITIVIDLLNYLFLASQLDTGALEY